MLSGVPTTATSNATPKAAPTCRRALLTAPPIESRSGGSSGDCLREALESDELERRHGIMRCGTLGAAWKKVEKVVADLQPESDADWEAVAVWVLDGDAGELVA